MLFQMSAVAPEPLRIGLLLDPHPPPAALSTRLLTLRGLGGIIRSPSICSSSRFMWTHPVLASASYWTTCAHSRVLIQALASRPLASSWSYAFLRLRASNWGFGVTCAKTQREEKDEQKKCIVHGVVSIHHPPEMGFSPSSPTKGAPPPGDASEIL